MTTPQEARAELARRELARRELARRASFKKEEPKKFGMGGAARAGLYGGVPGFGITPGSENILPAVGQAIGTSAGFLPGVASAMAGEVARQGVKGLRGLFGGTGERFDPNAIGRTGFGAGTTEAVFRGTGKLLRPTANRLMQSALKASVPVRTKYPNLGIEALEEGIFGTRGQMLKKSETLAKKSESELQKLLSGRPEKVNLKNVVAEL